MGIKRDGLGRTIFHGHGAGGSKGGRRSPALRQRLHGCRARRGAIPARALMCLQLQLVLLPLLLLLQLLQLQGLRSAVCGRG